ncbi:hypothetical protein Q1695_014659 [Nippostrongylus brasiliensis]|nr:hypothetical protein Q1695_014659 [Nippostrongylus brasiliensis]
MANQAIVFTAILIVCGMVVIDGYPDKCSKDSDCTPGLVCDGDDGVCANPRCGTYEPDPRDNRPDCTVIKSVDEHNCRVRKFICTNDHAVRTPSARLP